MVGKLPDKVPLGERSVQYKRARWKHAMRYFGLFVVVMLNISLVMSNIQMHQLGKELDWKREVLSYVVVLFFDVTILLPLLLEVDNIAITPDAITLGGLFTKKKINWKDVTDFKAPLYLRYAILRSGKSIYLLNKKDLKPYEELVEIIQFKRAKAIQ